MPDPPPLVRMHSSRPLRAFALVTVLAAAGALLFPVAARALHLFGQKRRPIIHGKRPFERPYTGRRSGGIWKTLATNIEDDLVAVSALDSAHAWATGNSGGLYRTRDGGATWKTLIGVDVALYEQMAWVNPDRGFALTRDGGIVRTDDGGAQWKALDLGVKGRIRHVAFVGSAEGWAVGDAGLILHTRDAGETWERQNEEGDQNLTTIQMIDALVGWAGGEKAILRTEDAGHTWQPLQGFPLWTFVSGRRGFASDGRSIYRTENGGRRWDRMWTLPGGAPRDLVARMQFVDRYNGIAETFLGGKQVFFGTEREGRYWKRLYEVRRGSPGELVATKMVDGRRGFAVDAEGNLRGTRDGGRTWNIEVEARAFDLTDVDFVDARRGWAVSTSGRVLVTEDGGTQWREAPRRVSKALRRVRAVASGAREARAWAVGDDGTLVSSSLGGVAWRRSWREQNGRTQATLRGLAFADLSRGIAVGDDGAVLATEDGGSTWRPLVTNARSTLRAVIFTDARHVLIAGDSVLLGSLDGGRTFQPEPVPPDARGSTLVDLAAPDPTHLYALGEEGSLLRSTDGGAHWERVPVAERTRLERVAFVDASTGWILGQRLDGTSVVLLTTDGGGTWRERGLPARDVRAIHFVNQELGWAVGRQTILVTRDGGKNWRRQAIGPARVVRAVAMADEGGFAVGDNGLALRYVPPPGPVPALRGKKTQGRGG
jgi:photosystem II stability/assembly factor-like uncharacterized protein